MKRLFHKVAAWLACLLLLAALLPAAARAREPVDTGKTGCTLSITYPCQDIEFLLYRVADISETGSFTLAEDFQQYQVSFVDLDKTGWKDLTATLDAYIRRDQLSPLDQQTTGQDGQLVFTGRTPGLYLVTWGRHTTGGYTYTPQPVLISLPGLDKSNHWTYSVNATLKYDKEEVPVVPPNEPHTVSRRALKIWQDKGNEASRPSSVTVQLLQNGTVYQEAVLSAANNWRCQWTDLDADDTWQVVEKDIPNGYTVSVGRDNITFTVTNTLTPPPPDNPDPPENPDGPDNPPVNPGAPDYPLTDPDMPTGAATPDPSGNSGLPQTGQLWWPVPMLACGGIGLFLAGWLKRRGSERGGKNE